MPNDVKRREEGRGTSLGDYWPLVSLVENVGMTIMALIMLWMRVS